MLPTYVICYLLSNSHLVLPTYVCLVVVAVGNNHFENAHFVTIEKIYRALEGSTANVFSSNGLNIACTDTYLNIAYST